MDALGGRKVIVGIVVLAIGVAMVLIKGDLTSNLLQLLQVVFGAFVVGNVGEHIVNGSVMKAETTTAAVKPEEPAALEVVAAALTRLEESAARQEQAVALSQQALSAIMTKAGIK